MKEDLKEPNWSIEDYLNIQAARGPSFGPEGGRVAFRMDTTGVYQAWIMEEPDSWPEQITFGDDRVEFVDYSPTRPHLVFGMDQEGNEKTQLYLYREGRPPRNLTQSPGDKHVWGEWSPSGDRIAYASNRREPSVFDIWVQRWDQSPEDARCVMEGNGWLTVGDWSPDGTRLIVVQSYSNFDQTLYHLDIAEGTLLEITPDVEDVRFRNMHWGPDRHLYFLTDYDRDLLYLARMKPEGGDIEPVRTDPDRAFDGFTMNEDGGDCLLTRNRDGYSDLFAGNVLDETISRVPVPGLPEGVFAGMDLPPSGDRAVLSLSSPEMNPNIYTVDLSRREMTRWTDVPTAGIPRDRFRTPHLIHYESFDDLEIPAFLTEPDTASGPNPVIVSIHGGPESQRRPGFKALRAFFLDSGFAFFEPNVRGSSGYGRHYMGLDDVRKRMDSVRDIREGVRWLRENRHVKPEQFAVMGGSYGGFMVLANLAEYPDLWAAGVCRVGIANFISFLENTGPWRRNVREAEYGSLDEDRDFLRRISPTSNADRIQAPLMVIHGENDPRVPVEEAERIVESLKGRQVPVEKLIFPDEGHGISRRENRIRAYRNVDRFLRRHVLRTSTDGREE